MKQIDRRVFSSSRKESGTVAVLVALCLIVIVGFLALALDIGYVMVTRNESQDAADAAALAGARQLGENYYDKIPNKTVDVENVSQTTAGLNKVATQNVSQDNVDIKIGWWDQVSGTFTETSTSPNAVQATVTRRTGAHQRPHPHLCRGRYGHTQFSHGSDGNGHHPGRVHRDCRFPPRDRKELVHEHRSKQGFAHEIAINDTMSSCAGWTNLQNKPYKWKDVDNIITKKTPVPVVNIGNIIEFGGGTVETMLEDLYDRFVVEAAKGGGKWRVTVPVFEDYDVCQNPNKPYEVIGYATMDIENVIMSGNNKGLYGRIICEEANLTRGTCFYAGTYGAIPGLVK